MYQRGGLAYTLRILIDCFVVSKDFQKFGPCFVLSDTHFLKNPLMVHGEYKMLFSHIEPTNHTVVTIIHIMYDGRK